MSCVDAIKASIARIKEVNQDINACVDVCEDLALAAAVESDKRIAENDFGPLEGLPIVVKANIEVIDTLTTAGTPALKDFRPKADAEVVTILKKAGAIIIAKTNMPEMAFGFVG